MLTVVGGSSLSFGEHTRQAKRIIKYLKRSPGRCFRLNYPPPPSRSKQRATSASGGQNTGAFVMSILNCIGGCSVLRWRRWLSEAKPEVDVQLPETLTVPMFEHYQFILSLTRMPSERGEVAFLSPPKNVNPPPYQTPHYQYFIKFWC